jgi:CHAD domain-containing protein
MRRLTRSVQRTSRAMVRASWRRQGWPALDAGLRDSYRRARRRFRSLHTTAEDPAFHAWRTASKSLMYQLALLRPAEPRRIKALVSELDLLQETLGEEHDLAVLAARLKRSRRNLKGPDALDQVNTLIVTKQQRLRKQALRLGRHLFAAKPKDFVERRHREWKSWRKG